MTETEEKIQQLQLLEQNLQNILIQKQASQSQSLEIDNALKELSLTTQETYKIISNIMIKTNKEKLINELNSKKEILSLRIKNLEKQETQLKEKAKTLQQEVIKELK